MGRGDAVTPALSTKAVANWDPDATRRVVDLTHSLVKTYFHSQVMGLEHARRPRRPGAAPRDVEDVAAGRR